MYGPFCDRRATSSAAGGSKDLGSTTQTGTRHDQRPSWPSSGHPSSPRGKRWASQSDLAKALGVSRQTIHTWKTEPSRQERLDRVLALQVGSTVPGLCLCTVFRPHFLKQASRRSALCACAGTLLALQL